jgi:hypothetical protein
MGKIERKLVILGELPDNAWKDDGCRCHEGQGIIVQIDKKDVDNFGEEFVKKTHSELWKEKFDQKEREKDVHEGN